MFSTSPHQSATHQLNHYLLVPFRQISSSLTRTRIMRTFASCADGCNLRHCTYLNLVGFGLMRDNRFIFKCHLTPLQLMCEPLAKMCQFAVEQAKANHHRVALTNSSASTSYSSVRIDSSPMNLSATSDNSFFCPLLR